MLDWLRTLFGSAQASAGARPVEAVHQPDFLPYLIPAMGAPPYAFMGMTMFAFSLETRGGLAENLQNQVDRYLNEPLAGRHGQGLFEVVSNRILLLFSRVEAASRLLPGSVSYQEASFQIPVLVERKRSGFFLPILFVDGPAGNQAEWHSMLPIVIGREAYGLPKLRAEIAFENRGIEFLGGSVDLAGERMIRVDRLRDGGRPPDEPLSETERLGIARSLFGDFDAPGTGAATEPGGPAVDTNQLANGPLLFGLRQLREPRDFAKARYQDVVQSQLALESPAPWPLGSQVEINFDPAATWLESLDLHPTYRITNPLQGFVYTDANAHFGGRDGTRVWSVYP